MGIEERTFKLNGVPTPYWVAVANEGLTEEEHQVFYEIANESKSTLGDPSYTYDVNNILQTITYADSPYITNASKTFSYNGDGTLDTVVFARTYLGSGLTKTSTYGYTGGLLTSTTNTEV